MVIPFFILTHKTPSSYYPPYTASSNQYRLPFIIKKGTVTTSCSKGEENGLNDNLIVIVVLFVVNSVKMLTRHG